LFTSYVVAVSTALTDSTDQWWCNCGCLIADIIILTD